MSDFVTRIVVVDPSAEGREQLRNMVLGVDSVLLEAEFAHYESALSAFLESKPDGVVVSLDQDPPQALDLVGRVLVEYPRLPVVVISNRPDLLIQAYRLGAKLLLDQPVKPEELMAALRDLSDSVSLQRPPKGKVIALLPSRGGVGCTSLAVNLASTLAADPTRRVVLIDLDFVTGAADVALDLVPEYRLGDLAGQIEKIDLLALRNLLTQAADRLWLLPRPARCQEIALITPDHIQRIVTLLRITHSHVIIDLSKGWRPTDLRAMELAEVVLFITELDLGSLRNAVLLSTSLADAGLSDKVRVVMNRVGADYGGGSIDLHKAEEVLGRSVYWQVPNDYKSVVSAWNEGAPLSKIAPRCKVQQTIAAMAADLSGPAQQAGKATVPAHGPP